MQLNVTFYSGDKIFEIKKNSELRILSINGIADIKNSIVKSNIRGNGTVITGSKIEAKDIDITFEIKKNENEDINRDNILRFFNPNNTGYLVVERNDVARKINYMVEDVKELTKNLAEWQTFKLYLYCSDPLFSSLDNYGKDISEIENMFIFPLTLTNDYIMGYKVFAEEIEIINDGVIETGITVDIEATAEVVNPKFIINDDFIELNTTLELGDKIEICTNSRNKYIKLNGENIIQRINRESTFASLKVGSNTIGYTAESGYNFLNVKVYFNKKYLGV